MSTIWIREFVGGLDTRRLPETSPNGTLVKAVDCHLNRGGELEQRADFVELFDSNDAIVGLAVDKDGLVVFGNDEVTPVDLPPNAKYQRLQDLNGEDLVGVPAHSLYQGRLQCVGEFADTNRYLFDDGVIVDDASAPPFREGTALPLAIQTFASKVFSSSGAVLYFSGIRTATDYSDDALGSGFVDMSTHFEGSSEITALSPYQGKLAVFSDRGIQIWNFDENEDNTQRNQVLPNIGTLHPRSVVGYGEADVFFLDRNGVRSLRARDSSGAASSSDIGSPIDTTVSRALRDLPQGSRALLQIEPQDGRLWVAVGDRIFVLSLFPGSNVTAWTEYRPGFTVKELVAFGGRMYVLSEDGRLFVYGSLEGDYSYSADVVAEAWLPYLDAGAPAATKVITGIDAAVRGSWRMSLALSPTFPAAEDLIAQIDETSFETGRIPASGASTHLSLRFRSAAPPSPNEPAILSSAIVHFEGTQEEQ